MARSNALRSFELLPLARAFWPLPGRLFDLRPEFLFAAAVDFGPFAAQRGHQHGFEERFDIGPAGVMGADLRAFGGIEDALEERAEDRRLDVRPIGIVDRDEDVDFLGRQREDFGVGEQSAVEPEDFVGAEIAAPCDMAWKRFSSRRGERGGIGLAVFEDFAEKFRRQQADVFAEHAEHELHEEVGDAVRRDARVHAEAVGQIAEAVGGLLGDRFAADARMQGVRDR